MEKIDAEVWRSKTEKLKNTTMIEPLFVHKDDFRSQAIQDTIVFRKHIASKRIQSLLHRLGVIKRYIQENEINESALERIKNICFFISIEARMLYYTSYPVIYSYESRNQ